MSYIIRIFCTKCDSLSPEEIISYIEDGFFFETELHIIPEKKDNSNWILKIEYDKDKSPLTISTLDDDAVARKRIDQLKSILQISKKSKKKVQIEGLLNAVCRIFTIEIIQDEITDDCWEMLDATEAMIMKKCDGTLFTDDNEFFNNKLKKIYKL